MHCERCWVNPKTHLFSFKLGLFDRVRIRKVSIKVSTYFFGFFLFSPPRKWSPAPVPQLGWRDTSIPEVSARSAVGTPLSLPPPQKTTTPKSPPYVVGPPTGPGGLTPLGSDHTVRCSRGAPAHDQQSILLSCNAVSSGVSLRAAPAQIGALQAVCHQPCPRAAMLLFPQMLLLVPYAISSFRISACDCYRKCNTKKGKPEKGHLGVALYLACGLRLVESRSASGIPVLQCWASP